MTQASKTPYEVEAAFGRPHEAIQTYLTHDGFLAGLAQVRASALIEEVSKRRGMLRWAKRNVRHGTPKLDATAREEIDAIQAEFRSRGKWEQFTGRMVLLCEKIDRSTTDVSDAEKRRMDDWYAQQAAIATP